MRVPPRIHRRNYNIPGEAHALTFSCYHRYPFLWAERTRSWLANAINDARVVFDFDFWCYVFMPEHVHMIVRPRQKQYDIAEIRQAIKAPVGRAAIEYLQLNAPHWLPRLTRKRGRRTERLFWQSGGGYDRNIDSTATLLATIDYIHLNPVRRGYVDRAVDWKWSSASWFILGQPGPIVLDPIPPEWLD